MDGYDSRRVLEEALDKLSTPKGWLILAGSVTGMYILHRKGVMKMGGYDQRRVLEKLIDSVGDSDRF